MRLIALLAAIALYPASSNAQAQQTQEPEKERRHFAISLFAGVAVPVGEFDDVGNHKVGGLVTLEVEWYLVEELSAGLWLSGAIFDDKDLGNAIKTEIQYLGGFVKGSLPLAEKWSLNGKFGVALADLTFDGQGFNLETDATLGLLFAGGVTWRLTNALGLNAQISYTNAATKGVSVPDLDTEVDFDTRYIGFDFGVTYWVF